jgi:predicted nucleic acid-binding protein
VNVFVYYLTAHPSFVDKASYWIHNTDEIYTSELTFYQLIIIISHLTGEKEEEVTRKIAEALYNFGVKFVHLEVDELYKVYEISRKYKLDFEDAIHFYCSLKINAELISNDSDMKKLGAKF